MPALQWPELPAAVAVAERLLEGIASAHVLPDRRRMWVARATIQDRPIDVTFVAHQLGHAGILQPDRAMGSDEVDQVVIGRVERNRHRFTPFALDGLILNVGVA